MLTEKCSYCKSCCNSPAAATSAALTLQSRLTAICLTCNLRRAQTICSFWCSKGPETSGISQAQTCLYFQDHTCSSLQTFGNKPKAALWGELAWQAQGKLQDRIPFATPYSLLRCQIRLSARTAFHSDSRGEGALLKSWLFVCSNATVSGWCETTLRGFEPERHSQKEEQLA